MSARFPKLLELDLIFYSAKSLANEEDLSSSNFAEESYSSIRETLAKQNFSDEKSIRQTNLKIDDTIP